jgi:predicted small integral membrane protein
MNILRICKSIVCFLLAVFALLVCLNNLLDYGSNYAFVQHTLSMDTVFPSNALKYRAILNPFVWSLAYGLIIFAEFVTGLLLLVGAIGLLKNIHTPSAFNGAKNWVYLGCLVGFLLWFFGFIVIGGEWFCMWQSEKWNGIEAAFRFAFIIMFTLIFTALPEPESHQAS